jgi:uncharacterized protein (TIGR02246 family)
MTRIRTAAAAAMVIAVTALVAAQVQRPATLTPDDHAAIQQLYARYAHGLDTAADNGQLFMRVFTTDAVLTDVDGKTYKGHQQLAELARSGSNAKGPANASHFIYNVLIEPTPGGAVGKSYIVVAQLTTPGTPAAVITGGQYHDVLVRTAEGWRISSRTFVRANNYPTTPAR